MLVCLIFFNAVGYYLLFMGLKVRTASQINELLSEEESLEALEVEQFTFPFQGYLPYPPSSEIVSDVRGEFEHKGQVYRFVESTIFNDSITFKVVKDRKSTQMKGIFKAYAEKATGKPLQKGEKSSFLPIFNKDYIITRKLSHYLNRKLTNAYVYAALVLHYKSLSVSIDTPPPECRFSS
jgi:hypothetical protein